MDKVRVQLIKKHNKKAMLRITSRETASNKYSEERSEVSKLTVTSKGRTKIISRSRFAPKNLTIPNT